MTVYDTYALLLSSYSAVVGTRQSYRMLYSVLWRIHAFEYCSSLARDLSRNDAVIVQ